MSGLAGSIVVRNPVSVRLTGARCRRHGRECAEWIVGNDELRRKIEVSATMYAAPPEFLHQLWHRVTGTSNRSNVDRLFSVAKMPLSQWKSAYCGNCMTHPTMSFCQLRPLRLSLLSGSHGFGLFLINLLMECGVNLQLHLSDLSMHMWVWMYVVATSIC